MSIKRYTAIKDNTITNAYEPNLQTRGTGSNMGAADSTAVFSIFAQESSSSIEKARFLTQFPITSSGAGTATTILEDRQAGNIPASGSVNFYLRIFNVVHDQTLPRKFTLLISPVSQSWEEGYGYDLDSFKDLTYNGTGSNWINAKAHTPWTNEGGDFLTASAYSEYNYSDYFETGVEDLSVDITGLVEQWITGTAGDGLDDYGVGIFLTGSEENSTVRSYYTKMFSARSSEYFFKRPIIEARWDSSRKDNRGNFIISSSVLNSTDNLNTLYIYNYYRGQLQNLNGVGTGSIYLTTWTSASSGEQLTTTPISPVTGGWVATGIYSASFALSTTASVVYDRWYSGSIAYHTGSFAGTSFGSSNIYTIPSYITAITNLKDEYSNDELARFRLYTRLRNWNPTIYTVASTNIENDLIENSYYEIYRVVDNYTVIEYGTGSLNQTRLSYDVTGSYFDLDMRMLEAGYSYGIKFVFYLNGSYQEQSEHFKFRVE